MKSLNKFLLVSYANSLLETAALIGVPFLGLYVFVEHGAGMAMAAVAVGLLAAGFGLSVLTSLESAVAGDHADERRVRRR